MSSGFITLGRGNIVRETEKAICVSITDNHNAWLPKSLVDIEYNENDGQTIYLHMPVWLAKKNGMFGYDCFGRAIFHITD